MLQRWLWKKGPFPRSMQISYQNGDTGKVNHGHQGLLEGPCALLTCKTMEPEVWPSFGWLACVLVAQSCPTLCNPWTVTHEASLSMEFSRQEYWSGLPFPSPEDLPNSRIKPWSHALQADSLLFELQGSPLGDWSRDLFHLAWGQDCGVTRRGAALCEEIPEASQQHPQKRLCSGEFCHHLWETFNSSHFS